VLIFRKVVAHRPLQRRVTLEPIQAHRAGESLGAIPLGLLRGVERERVDVLLAVPAGLPDAFFGRHRRLLYIHGWRVSLPRGDGEPPSADTSTSRPRSAISAVAMPRPFLRMGRGCETSNDGLKAANDPVTR